MLNKLNNLKRLTVSAAVAFGALLLPQLCLASANEYALPRIINVGILRIPSAGQSGPSPTGVLVAPYIFDILNHRPDVKPPLWDLVNPLAPPVVSAEISSRFGGVYPLNEQVTPNMAPYWEVDLSKITSASQLQQFNLLVIAPYGDIKFTILERQILRQYVDQGGTLWIDLDGSGTSTFDFDQDNPFRLESSFSQTNPHLPSIGQGVNPLLDSPYTLTQPEIEIIGERLDGDSSVFVSDLNAAPDTTLFQRLGFSAIAGDYGSGHIIVDGLGIGEAINSETSVAATTNYLLNLPPTYPTDITKPVPGWMPSLSLPGGYAWAPTVDLQFLVNLLSYATVSTNSGANVRGNGAQGANLTGGLTASWQDFFANGTVPEGVATYGKFAYVSDSGGNLSSFDVNPAESIYQSAVNGDDGILDYSDGKSYDEMQTVQPTGAVTNLSAPVIALMPVNGGNFEVVMVQDSNGNVYGYLAAPAQSPIPLSSSFSLIFELKSTGTGSFPGTVPGPTYYRGHIFVPEPGSSGGVGTLNVYDTPPASSPITTPIYSIQVGDGNWKGPLLVASIPSLDTGNGAGTTAFGGEEIVGYVVNDSGIVTLELGSRDEHLNYNTTTASTSFFETHASEVSGVTNTDLIGAPEDTAFDTSDGYFILDFNSDNNGNVFNFPATIPALASSFAVGTVSAEETLYGDYDVQPSGGVAPIRSTIIASPDGNAAEGANVVGAAVGPDNVIYMTVNEPTVGTTGSGYIEAINEQSIGASSAILWRFELTGGTGTNEYVDASGITYDFYGYQFVGAPVVSTNGVVYALVVNPIAGITRLMAFNTKPTIGFGTSFDNFRVSQTDEFNNITQVASSQYGEGYQINNFSPSNQGNLQATVYVPGNLSIQQYSNTQPSTPQGDPVTVAINTSFDGAIPLLEWYVQLPLLASSAPRLVGDYIYFGTAASGTVPGGTVAVCADPSRLGLQPNETSRAIASNADYRFVQDTPSRIGSVTLPPTGTDKYIVTGGSGGIEGLAYNSILVADGNRLVEFDPTGNLSWSMDSTQQPSPENSAALYGGGTITPGSSTSVPLNRPSTVTQLGSGDYLIADTGNNRIVQVDRTGSVLSQFVDPNGHPLVTSADGSLTTEISSFSDPLGLLPVGQPLTLNHPNSVVTWETYEYDNSPYSGNGYINAINVHYLIADTGNNRILDIVDRYTASNLEQIENAPYYWTISSPSDYHYLNWVSHTSDIANRHYEYVGAEPILDANSLPGTAVYPDGYIPGSSDTVTNQATGIIGLVGNKNIAALDINQPTRFPNNYQDTSGSSILLLQYSSGTNSYQSGLPYQLINSVAAGSASNPTILPLRGLRSAVATAYSSTPYASLETFVIADNDGVFEGTYTGGAPTNLSTYSNLLDATYGSTSVGWSFTANDYDGTSNAGSIVNQYNELQADFAGVSQTNTYVNYANTPFVPASAIELSGNNYLIVNRGASGNPNSAVQNGIGLSDSGFGGDVFTVHADVSSNAPPVDTLDGQIYGHPANGSALSAPSFGLRSN